MSPEMISFTQYLKGHVNPMTEPDDLGDLLLRMEQEYLAARHATESSDDP